MARHPKGATGTPRLTLYFGVDMTVGWGTANLKRQEGHASEGNSQYPILLLFELLHIIEKQHLS